MLIAKTGSVRKFGNRLVVVTDDTDISKRSRIPVVDGEGNKWNALGSELSDIRVEGKILNPLVFVAEETGE